MGGISPRWWGRDCGRGWGLGLRLGLCLRVVVSGGVRDGDRGKFERGNLAFLDLSISGSGGGTVADIIRGSGLLNLEGHGISVRLMLGWRYRSGRGCARLTVRV